MQIIVQSAQFFISDKVLVFSHVFCDIYAIYLYAPLAAFKRFRLHCVRKKSWPTLCA